MNSLLYFFHELFQAKVQIQGFVVVIVVVFFFFFFFLKLFSFINHAYDQNR